VWHAGDQLVLDPQTRRKARNRLPLIDAP
jgi:hypothetical protein